MASLTEFIIINNRDDGHLLQLHALISRWTPIDSRIAATFDQVNHETYPAPKVHHILYLGLDERVGCGRKTHDHPLFYAEHFNGGIGTATEAMSIAQRCGPQISRRSQEGSTNLDPGATRKFGGLASLDDLPIACGTGCSGSGAIDASAETRHNDHDRGDKRKRGDLEMSITVGGHDRVVH